jgi:hypothetical protein
LSDKPIDNFNHDHIKRLPLYNPKKHISNIFFYRARSHTLVVEADSSRPRGRGFKSWHNIMDKVSFNIIENEIKDIHIGHAIKYC